VTEEKASSERASRKVTFAEIAALITALAAAVYVLGLVALFIPNSLAYTGDFSTAWYAVSLVPKTVVAGHGVRQLLAQPLLGIFLVVALVLLNYWVSKRFGRVWLRRMNAILSIGGVVVLVLMPGPRNVEPTPETITPLDVLREAIIALIGVAVVILGSYWAARYSRQGRFLLAAISVFAGLFLASLLRVTTNDPPLPRVDISGTEEIQGRLVTHYDRVWYVFTEQGNLVAVPDEKAGIVRVCAVPNS